MKGHGHGQLEKHSYHWFLIMFYSYIGSPLREHQIKDSSVHWMRYLSSRKNRRVAGIAPKYGVTTRPTEISEEGFELTTHGHEGVNGDEIEENPQLYATMLHSHSTWPELARSVFDIETVE